MDHLNGLNDLLAIMEKICAVVRYLYAFWRFLKQKWKKQKLPRE